MCTKKNLITYSEHKSLAPPQGLEEFEVLRSISSEQTTGDIDEPKIKFVFWEHVPENSAVAAAQLKECDVVALELLGTKASERLRIEQAATTYVSSTATYEEHRKAARVIKRTLPDMYRGLLLNLQGSDKKIVTLDADRGDDEEKLVRKSSRAYNKVDARLILRAPSAKIGSLLVEAASVSAAEMKARDAKSQSQIQGLHNMYAGSSAKIGVVYGAAHTSIYHGIREYVPSERVFIGGVASPRALPGERYRYNSLLALERSVQFLPNKPVPQSMLDAAVLDAMYLTADPGLGESHHVDFNSERMTHEEMSGILEEIDVIKSSIASRLLSVPGLDVRSRVSKVLKKHDRRQD